MHNISMPLNVFKRIISQKKRVCMSFQRSLIILTLLSFTTTLQAQKWLGTGRSEDQYTSVGIGGGSAHYIGDLTVLRYIYQVPYTNVRWNGHAHYSRFFSPQFGVKAAFSWVRLAGDDFIYSGKNVNAMPLTFIRNLHFRNDVKEFTLQGIWNLLPQYNMGIRGRKTVMPYATLGFGFIGHNPQARELYNKVEERPRGWTPLKPLATEGQSLPGYNTSPYSLVQLVVPAGLGVRYKATENIDVSFEVGFRFTTTDHLDDVSARPYVDPDVLRTYVGSVGKDLASRGTEQFHALTGRDRSDLYAQAVSAIGSPSATLTDAPNFYGFPAGANRGSGTAFYHRFDYYLISQFTVSYSFGSRVKCPPIR